MSETVRALLRLQQVDGQIRRAQAELADLAQKRARSEAAREAERSAVDGALAPLAESEKLHRQLEAELADLETTLARLEVQLYEVKSKQAFEGIQREIAHAREQKSALEDQILAGLDSVDGARLQVAQAEASLEAGARAGAIEAEAAVGREAELEAELARLEPIRAECKAAVADKPFRHYDRLRQRKWPAALLLKGDSCPGCRIKIAPQTRNDIRKGEEIITCLGCERILYDEKVVAGEESLQERP